MKIYCNQFPWKHWIIDDFIGDRALKYLQDQIEKRAVDLPDKPIKSGHFPVDLPDKSSQDIVTKAILQMPEVIEKLLYKAPRHHHDMYTSGELVITSKGYKYPPHCEGQAKVWSFVTYIGPEKSQGTFLMSDSNGSDMVEVPWKPGRCLVMAGEDNITWHSYECKSRYRSTITGFMVRPDLAEGNYEGVQ